MGADVDSSTCDKEIYRDTFDKLLLEIVIKSINDRILICNEIWFQSLYPIQSRVCAADAGRQIGISEIEAIPIFVLFSAMEFESNKTILDKIFRRKKDTEKRHLAVHNFLVDEVGGPIESYCVPWIEAYRFNLVANMFEYIR